MGHQSSTPVSLLGIQAVVKNSEDRTGSVIVSISTVILLVSSSLSLSLSLSLTMYICRSVIFKEVETKETEKGSVKTKSWRRSSLGRSHATRVGPK